MRPLVAISASTRVTDGAERVRLNQAYVDAIERAGLLPIIIPPLNDPSDVHQVLAAVSGLVLSGGEDVDPLHYGEDRHPATGDPHPERDACELELARWARDHSLPTLAICRGVQLLNVSLGGTLIQDIPSLISNAESHEASQQRAARTHAVHVEPDSHLAEALGTTDLRVNSIHHQALDRVAAGLRVTARAADGVIEGVEWSDNNWWALGVQWHPEELTDTSEAWDRRLFAAFAAACEGRSAVPRA
ncbi:MAG: gamma-glutamyl-gamma-aminobutyrate hydrolase family protein [Gemmatimonadaceae bacterium]